MATRKPFLFRADPAVLAVLKRWAAHELRSVNGQMDYLPRRALREAGRFPKPPAPDLRFDPSLTPMDTWILVTDCMTYTYGDTRKTPM